MANHGYISVHRKIQTHWLWEDKPFSKGQAFVDMLMKANHKANKFPFKNNIILVERGQFIRTERHLSDDWGWSRTKIRSFLKMLQEDSMIVQKKDQGVSVVTICNYEQYQVSAKQEKPKKNHEKTTEEPRKDLNNKDNKDNKSFTPAGEQSNLFLFPEPDKPKTGTNDFMRWWCAAYKFKVGKQYIITNYGKYGKLIKGLLSQMSLDDLKFMAMDYFLSEDDFHSGNEYTFEIFHANMNKLRLHTDPEFRQNSIEYLDVQTFERINHE